jgi:hypothetical protein
MATKDITDEMVCRAVAQYCGDQTGCAACILATSYLTGQTGEPSKVVISALERAYRHRLIDYGVSICLPWLTEAGKQLIANPSDIPQEPNHV